MIHHIARWPLVLYLGLLAGCANVPKDAGFPDVQKTVMERTGKRIGWDQGTAADMQVEEMIHSMLHSELTADAAVQIALLNNQNLQATYEELGIAQAELVEAGLLKNPTLSAEVGFPAQPKVAYTISIVDDFLGILFLPLRKNIAGSAFEAAKAKVANEVLITAGETKAAFYRAQAQEQSVEMRRNVARATDASFEVAKRLHSAGNMTDLVYAQERALHEQARIDLAKAEAETLAAREELNALMGVWGDQTMWNMAARLPELPGAEIEPGGLESLAVAQRLDLAAAKKEVQALANSLGLTKRTALLSQINISGHINRDTEGPITSGPGIELPLPIFNHGQPAIAAGTARLRQAQKRFAALAVQIRSDVRRSRDRMMAARDRANYYRLVILPLRHQIVQQTQLAYNAMATDVFQLLLAKKDEIDAGRDYVESLRDYWLARVELERAVGGKLETTGPSTQPSATQPSTQPAGTGAEEHHHH